MSDQTSTTQNLQKPAWLDLLQRGQSEEVKRQLLSIWYSSAHNFGQDALPIVKHILGEKIKSGLPSELRKMFLGLEIENIDILFRAEVSRLLRENLLDWTAISDLFSDLQRYAYYHLFSPEDLDWGQDFVKAIASNEQVLGNKSIKFWVSDFWATVGVKSTAHTTYDVVKYLEGSALIKALKQNDRDVLVKILKTYNWLHTLEINEQEVIKYERLMFDTYDKRRLQYFEQQDEVKAESTFDSVQPAAPIPSPSPSRPSFNVQDILNSRDSQNRGGVVYDNATNVKADEAGRQVQNERQKKREEIDRKIEELKKRKTV